MNTPLKIIIVVALVGLVAAALALKNRNKPAPSAAVGAPVSAPTAAQLPKLLDLGAGKCIPCKMMKPILDELKKDYADKFVTEFIDVWLPENASKAEQYGIRVIPTQIFFDATGKELFRHEGFFGKEDILNKWKELGVNVTNGGQP